MADKFDQFKKYILFNEFCQFVTSLYYILNEKYQVKTIDDKKLKFIMPYQKFKEILRYLRKNAKDSCGVVCCRTEKCLGHQTLEVLEQYESFMLDAVERRCLFYKYVKFIKIKNDKDPMMGYMPIPIEEVDLGWKSWSQRLSYLD